MTLGNVRELMLRRLTAVCAAAVMGSCALSPNNDTFSLYAEPGKYDFLDCANIAKRLTEASDREKQLAELMTRAREGAGGALVSAIAYQDEYNIARGRMQELRKAAEMKKCPVMDPEPSR
jgi:hypothetical protein